MGCVEGDFDSSTMNSMATDLAILSSEYRCTRLLMDLRNARMKLSMIDIYYVPKILLDIGVPLEFKRALVVSNLDEKYHFLELVSLNRAQRIRIFTDPESAINWLTECSDTSSK